MEIDVSVGGEEISMNVFIGELPPPYGGVAIKDKLLFQEVYSPIGVKMLNLVECKWKPWKIPCIGVKLVIYMFLSEHVIIGVGTNGRLKFLLQLRMVMGRKRGLANTQVIVMGGTIQKALEIDENLKTLVRECRRVWVETEEMRSDLIKQGLNNVGFFPNCRLERGSKSPTKAEERIRYVFFSRICPEKGIEDIIEATSKFTGSWSIDFYGELDDRIKKRFLEYVDSYDNVVYHGVFDQSKNDVYSELNKYDVMLLPSRWINEGVPGALLEAKMSGITAVVSKINYNAGIICDEVDGLLIHKGLLATVNKINRNNISKLKYNSYISRHKYCLETYVHELRKYILDA